MDAPPEQEDCRPFIRIAGHLESMALNAPRILAANLDEGFLLLSDLGETQYLQKLQDEPESSEALYADALDVIKKLQTHGAAFQSLLPPFDDTLIRFELSLFCDWLCGTHLGIEFTDEDDANWHATCDMLVANALDQPQVFVHRDYHSRNLMVTDDCNPGILDFQDAVEGPFTYDLVSLLKDCYVRWPEDQVRQWACDFYAASDSSIQLQIYVDLFMRHFELMGVQRHLKAAGIFARLNHRDGKPVYMGDVPRTLSYIVELGSRYEDLSFLAALITERCLPALQEHS